MQMHFFCSSYQQCVVYSITGRVICVAWMSSSISLTLSASTLSSSLSRCLQKCLCLNIPDVWSEEMRGCKEEAEEEEGERGRRDDKGLRTETAEGRRASRRCSLEYLLHWNWNVKGSVTECVCVLPLCAGRLAQVECHCPPPPGEGKVCVCGWGVKDESRLSVENHRDIHTRKSTSTGLKRAGIWLLIHVRLLWNCDDVVQIFTNLSALLCLLRVCGQSFVMEQNEAIWFKYL